MPPWPRTPSTRYPAISVPFSSATALILSGRRDGRDQDPPLAGGGFDGAGLDGAGAEGAGADGAGAEGAGADGAGAEGAGVDGAGADGAGAEPPPPPPLGFVS